MARQRLLPALAAATAICVVNPAFAASKKLELDPAAVYRELAQKPDNALLNFLSGLAYERTAVASSENRELARVAYRMALRQDNGFWRAAYQLGLMALEDRDAASAQHYLILAALNAPREPRVFRALARASYCQGDIIAAAAALAKADALRPPASEDDLLTAALIAAARKDEGSLNRILPSLSPALQEALGNRLIVPRAVVQNTAPIVKPGPPEANGKMAVVDVAIIRRNESSSTARGINLLDALSLQLGSSLINRNWTKTTDQIDPSQSSDLVTDNASFQLSIPTITYSLNIANARGNTSRMEARPTLLVYDDVESRIFDGGTLTFATDGQLSSSSETREVGLSLAVKPKFIDEDTVKLSVTVSLENFVPANPAGTFRQAVQTQKSSSVVSADLDFGQTILVSGGTSTTSTEGGSRTPLLGQLPLLGNLFSARNKSRQDNELLILLSLRKAPDADGPAMTSGQWQRTKDLRGRLFPDLAVGQMLEPETRQAFFQIANPARMDFGEYLEPLISKPELQRMSQEVRG